MADTSWLDDAPDASWLDAAPDASAVPAGVVADPKKLLQQKRGERAANLGPIEGRLEAFGESAAHALKQLGNLGSPLLVPDETVTRSEEMLRAVRKKHPLVSALGGMSIAVPPAVIAGGASIPAQIASGAVQGGAFSDPGERLEGAAWGGALSGLLPMATRAVRGIIKPAGSGKDLVAKGYGDKLSIGQMDPDSFVNKVEQAGEKVPLLGRFIRARRQEGQSIVADRLAQEMAPPGTSGVISQAGGMQPWLKEGLSRLDEAYNQLRSSATGPIHVTDKFPDIMAGASVSGVTGMTPPAEMTAKYLIRNTTAPMLDSQTITAAQKVRSDLRDLGRKYAQSADTSKNPDHSYIAEALKNAERAMTSKMNAVLSPADQAILSATDKAYSTAMMTRDALVKQSGIGNAASVDPHRVGELLRKSLGKTKTATGEGGDLRSFIEAAQGSMTEIPMTEGSQALSAARMGPLTFYQLGLDTLGAISGAAGVYSKTGQNLLKGSTVGQKIMSKAGDAMPEGTNDAVRAALIELLRQKKGN